MRNTIYELHDGLPLRGLVSVPYGHDRQDSWPLLVFLHANDEAAPAPLRLALSRHGPLRPGNNPVATSEFVVVAPQLPEGGDAWHRYGAAMSLVLSHVEDDWRIDPERIYLTGFNYGANGALDLAIRKAYPWAAAWAVEPTRVPTADPGVPIWLSAGSVARPHGRLFASRLRLTSATTPNSDRIYADEGLDHVSTATLAYADARVYRWLLKQRRRTGVVAATQAVRTDLR